VLGWCRSSTTLNEPDVELVHLGFDAESTKISNGRQPASRFHDLAGLDMAEEDHTVYR
jgi:hypothetical protein